MFSAHSGLFPIWFLLITTIDSYMIRLIYPINSNQLTIEDGTLMLLFDVNYTFIIIFDDKTTTIPENIAFTHSYPNKYNNCANMFSITEIKSSNNDNNNKNNNDNNNMKNIKYLINVVLPKSFSNSDKVNKLFICTKLIHYNNETQQLITQWIHQGENLFVIVKKSPYNLPLGVSICVAGVLIILSGLFSGLNIGLMSLQVHELEVIATTGKPHEQLYAKNIIPLRKLGNVLLVCILLSNTAVNSTLTIIIDKISTGTIAIVVSTICIMLIGEIIPQSICTRYALAIGSSTRYITWFFIIITSLISFPLGYLLNYMLGPEPPTIVGRQQLLELIRLHSKVANLDNEEVGIISGALNFRSKVVADAMVPIDKSFLLSEDAILDFETIAGIVQSGFSRIPIYSNQRTNIVGLLLMKDLTLVDPDDRVPLLSVVNFYKRPIIKVFSDITLDKLFHEFKNGVGHLAVVLEVKTDIDGGDPYYNSIGIITLEDIIEEIIQTEITDETDFFDPQQIISDKRKHTEITKKLLPFFHQESLCAPELSPNMILTICQFLSTALPAFSEDIISESILKSLITRRDVVLSYEPLSENEPIFLYQQNVISDTFTLILEGKVEVTFGRENITSILGPFSYFGISSLKVDTVSNLAIKIRRSTNFSPDFTVKVISNVLCLRIKSALYFDTLKMLGMKNDPKIVTFSSKQSLHEI